MFEELGQDKGGEVGGLVDDKGVALRGPRDDIVGIGVPQHRVQLQEEGRHGRLVEAHRNGGWGRLSARVRRLDILWERWERQDQGKIMKRNISFSETRGQIGLVG